jgi:hypothetical protein
MFLHMYMNMNAEATRENYKVTYIVKGKKFGNTLHVLQTNIQTVVTKSKGLIDPLLFQSKTVLL